MSFWGELKRRNVYKVGIAYAIVAWLLIQGADIIFPHLNLPSWAVTFLIVFLIIGFPVAILLAWAYEVTPDGIKRTKQVPLAESITHLTGQKLNYVVTALLVVAVAFLVVDNYYLDRRATEPKVVFTETEQIPVVSDVEEEPKTIAVIPFVNLSPDPDQEYFVDGLSEELLNCLSKLTGLRVTSRTSSFAFKDSDKTLQEIASVLRVENILEGSVRKAGNALRITAQLIRVKDDYHLWSETYDRELKDIFEVQEDIATTVADELKVTLGIDRSLEQLGGTDNKEAYELYLTAQGMFDPFDRTKLSRSLKLIDAAIALDPEFAMAWALKASMHEGLSIYRATDLVAVEIGAGVSAAQRAIEIEPNLTEAYNVLGSIRSAAGDWIEAELAYRKALKLATESSVWLESYPLHLFAVGYLHKAHELLKENRIRDPLNSLTRLNYLLSFAFLGDRQGAEKEIEKSMSFFDDIEGATVIEQVRLGSGGSVSRDVLSAVPYFGDLEIDLESKENGLAELRRLYNSSDQPASFLDLIPLTAAYLGDPEFAMDVMEKMTTSNPKSVFWIWLPVYYEARQLPRFKKFVKDIGLVDYWNKFGWPDICRPVGDDDFECF